MINTKLLKPQSIVIVGGSDDVQKPGGKVLKNLIDGNFKGNLYVSNPKVDEVQGLKSYRNIAELPQTDLAILAIPAKFCVDTVKLLVDEKSTRAFIILSAGFSEENEEGAEIEAKIVEKINSVEGSLIGPNCVGVLNENYNGIFTTPIPRLDPQGVDFISGSGATAVFIMESGVPKGLSFSSVWSVGNSAQIGVEAVLKHLDETYEPGVSSPVKLLYIENIDQPEMLLKHASSLIRKGCKIAAIKSGGSEAGSRAASSHTGALASSDVAVDALFRKSGIVRCNGREELASVASIFMHPELKGKNIAIITHAGGPAVMLTDSLSNGGLEIPHLDGPKVDALLEKLFPGSAVGNPIDFLATGTAEQLGHIIDACENDFDEIDGMAVIFGSPGLFPVFDVYDLLNEKMKSCKKPIYPILPSVVNVKDEIAEFVAKGRINFPDEVIFGDALCKVFHTSEPQPESIDMPKMDTAGIRKVIDNADSGYISPDEITELLDAAGISHSNDRVVNTEEDAIKFCTEFGYPVVMKVVGPVHKSDVGGVVLNVKDETTVRKEFKRLMQIKDTYAVQMFEMYFGQEIFIGSKREDKFGHMVLCGLGGIFIEVLKDVQSSLAPISKEEAHGMIQRLRSYGIIKGVRGQEGVNEDILAEQIVRVAALVKTAPEIFEMDLNPLLGNSKEVVAVDARIRIEKD
ncbi:MAG: acetate--CoA ligase family protein [Bacteroidales bacterium]|nr:acetate--CoA ligase family protein [Bacteroidales bacterium]